jgi:hypothetical protein
MKGNRGKYVVVIMFVGWCVCASAQQRNELSVYEAFDNTIGRKNLALNNGTIHTNPFPSIDETHRYFGKNEYTSGSVFYDGQPYNVSIKYDILKDFAIVKLDGENNQLGFNLISDKTQWFYIGDKKFVNLTAMSHPQFVSGFYEETLAGELTLYTKHSKAQVEVLTNEKVFYKYYEKNEFVLRYNNQWYKIDSKKDLAEILTHFENEISDFSLMNSGLEKSDRNQFMKNLVRYINNLLSKGNK